MKLPLARKLLRQAGRLAAREECLGAAADRRIGSVPWWTLAIPAPRRRSSPRKQGVSRGAMLHHFPSKIDIVRAAVEHLHSKRLKAFRKSIDRLPRDETRVRRALEAYFEHVKHPMYVAFLELWILAHRRN
jgi:hypothetical protein